MESGRMREIEEMPTKRHSTRMTRIGRILTDNFDPWVSASSAQSVSYRIPPIIYDDKKPQMKAPRVTPLEGVYTSTVAPVDVAYTYGSPPYVDIAARYACGHTWVRSREPAGFRHDERRYVHAAGFGKRIHRKGRKERKAAQQESLCPLCSLWLNVFSAPAPERAPPAPAVHPRLSCAGG